MNLFSRPEAVVAYLVGNAAFAVAVFLAARWAVQKYGTRPPATPSDILRDRTPAERSRTTTGHDA